MLLVEEKIFQEINIYFLYFSNLFFKSSGLNPKVNSSITTNITINKTKKASATGIQRGEVTQHQDQSMFPVSLRTKNTTNNTPVNPIPDEELFDAIIYYIPNLSNKLFLFWVFVENFGHFFKSLNE